MTNQPKLQIYQGMIQYLMDSTGYDLGTIAALSNATLKSLRSIYYSNEIPSNFSSSEKHLIQLYQMILDLNAKKGTDLRHLAKGMKNEDTKHPTGS